MSTFAHPLQLIYLCKVMKNIFQNCYSFKTQQFGQQSSLSTFPKECGKEKRLKYSEEKIIMRKRLFLHPLTSQKLNNM